MQNRENAQSVEVAIIGAGPYGLSMAAALDSLGISYIIFGKPMHTWANLMPEFMTLKSDGFASNLISPLPKSDLKSFCENSGTPYHDTLVQIPRSVFVKYGLDFCESLVTSKNFYDVNSIKKDGNIFHIISDDGKSYQARSVVVCVGIGHFKNIPSALSEIPDEYASHSYGHKDMSAFSGKHVTVIGGGASAVELAASLADNGSTVNLVIRDKNIKFNTYQTPDTRSFLRKIRHPKSGLGNSLRSWLCSELPLAFRYMPEKWRMDFLHSYLGPSASAKYKSTILNKVRVFYESEVVKAELIANKLEISTVKSGVSSQNFQTDHVIYGTGYMPKCENLKFLSETMRSEIDACCGYPRLTKNYESSVAGLYFTGLAAAGSFGPVMRFVYGAKHTTPSISRHIKKNFGQR